MNNSLAHSKPITTSSQLARKAYLSMDLGLYLLLFVLPIIGLFTLPIQYIQEFK